VPADDETVREGAWKFLEKAKQLTKKDSGPFKPTSARVSNVVDALAALCYLDSLIDPPAWLGDAGDLPPPATEMLPVANGLLHLPSGELYDVTPNYFGLSASDVVFAALALDIRSRSSCSIRAMTVGPETMDDAILLPNKHSAAI
jgi:putative DNA primase/helicase